MSLLDRYDQASEDTRRVVDRLLEQDVADQTWAAQVGPAYIQQDVADLLGKTKQAGSRDRRLLALRTRNGRIVYPAFQFDGRRLLLGLAELTPALVAAAATPWTVASWFTSASRSLGGHRPVDLLRQGELGPVRDAAAAFAHGLSA